MCFFDRYNALCRAKGKSANAVAKEIGISSGTVTTWKQNGNIPRLATIRKIADYFHIDMETLMRGVDEDEQNAAQDRDGAVSRLQDIYAGLSPEGRKKLEEYGELLQMKEGREGLPVAKS